MDKGASCLEFYREKTIRIVRFKGESIGSGGYKSYSKGVACLTYMYIEPSDEYDVQMIYEKLYSVLENDMIAAKFHTVFALCDKAELPFYVRHGYTQGKERCKEKLARIMGAYVIHDLTVQKKLV